MEHVIIVREHRGVCCCSRAGGCTLVALCPRGGRGEMVDRANEVELGAWRWGRGCSWVLLDDFGTFIILEVPFCHTSSPVPARKETAYQRGF
jgi:hypothetical protein